jgi:hypothetical protein
MSIITKQCQVCDVFFEALRPEGIYCSAACKQMAYRKKRNKKNKPQEIDEQVLQKLNSELDKLKELFEKRKAAIVKANSNFEYLNKLNKELDDKNNRMFEEYMRSRKIDNMNYKLKNWLKDLIKIDDSERYDSYTSRSLFKQIIDFKSTSLKDIPENYKYSAFIFQMLVPAIESFSLALQSESEYLTVELLSSEMKIRMAQILREI